MFFVTPNGVIFSTQLHSLYVMERHDCLLYISVSLKEVQNLCVRSVCLSLCAVQLKSTWVDVIEGGGALFVSGKTQNKNALDVCFHQCTFQ